MTHYDVVVVGGGINGVGVAQAAAAAGYSVLLLEKTGLAAGTSSKSSKLIHGGLRYLESYEFGLVRESLRERALLLRLAPDIVRLQAFCVPLYETTRRGPALLTAGLGLYWLLTGCADDGRFRRLPRSQWDALDGLRTRGLRAVFSYNDATTDDALLTRAVMQSAISLGAVLECPAHFVGATLVDDGCEVRFRTGAAEQTCLARTLVNAAGPWVNDVLQRVSPVPTTLAAELVQGTHIEIDGATGQYYYYLESPRDGRAVFVMPRGGRLVIGTTETRYRDDPDGVVPLPQEENYLLGVLRHYFPAFEGLDRGAIVSSWAGLRVLPGGEGHAFHRSRETVLYTDRIEQPRLLSIYGGKLTAYRATAEKVMQRIQPSLPDRARRADTRELFLEPA